VQCVTTPAVGDGLCLTVRGGRIDPLNLLANQSFPGLCLGRWGFKIRVPQWAQPGLPAAVRSSRFENSGFFSGEQAATQLSLRRSGCCFL
jgi:hypothetical protein